MKLKEIFNQSDKKTFAIKALAVLSFITIIFLWATQPTSVIIPLGNEHTDWILVDGVQYYANDYDHAENQPIRHQDVQILNKNPLKGDYHIHYEYDKTNETHISDNVSVNLTYYNASAVGEFNIVRYVTWIYKTPSELKEYLGISVPRYDNPGEYFINNCKTNL